VTSGALCSRRLLDLGGVEQGSDDRCGANSDGDTCFHEFASALVVILVTHVAFLIAIASGLSIAHAARKEAA
jgi:hypothetical protein